MFALAVGWNTLNPPLPMWKTQMRLLWALVSEALKHMLRFKHVGIVQVCSCHALPVNPKCNKVSLVRSSCWGHREDSPQFLTPGKPVNVCSVSCWDPPRQRSPVIPLLLARFPSPHIPVLLRSLDSFSLFIEKNLFKRLRKEIRVCFKSSVKDGGFRAFWRAVTALCPSLPPPPPLTPPGEGMKGSGTHLGRRSSSGCRHRLGIAEDSLVRVFCFPQPHVRFYEL